MTGEKFHKVWHSAMVNICIRSLQAPKLWVFVKIFFHVFVNPFLKIDAEGAIRAYYNIGANAFVSRHIPIWVRYCEIGRIISHLIFC